MSARPCPMCGRPVSGPEPWRYCSRACGNAADYARHAERRRAERRERCHRARGTAPPEGGRAELRARIVAALHADPHRSDKAHAAEVGAHASTVGRIRAALVAAGALPAVGWVTRRDGHPQGVGPPAPIAAPAERRYQAWTADEDRHMREQWGAPAREVALALGRTPAGVLHRRRALRRGRVGG